MPKYLKSAALVAGAVIAFAALPAHAESWPSCQGKIDRAVSRYQTAVGRYGEDSDKAYKERLKVREIKVKCHDQFGRWYDPRGGRADRDGGDRSSGY